LKSRGLGAERKDRCRIDRCYSEILHRQTILPITLGAAGAGSVVDGPPVGVPAVGFGPGCCGVAGAGALALDPLPAFDGVDEAEDGAVDACCSAA
jgi:hypothetical protein